MHLDLIRDCFSRTATVGRLYADGEFVCFTLEDCDRRLEDGGEKVPRETAIPRGTYEVVLDYSNRFKRIMPHVLDVPLFQGIRIHPGNTRKDTEGCILVGHELDEEFLLKSKIAYALLMERVLGPAVEAGEGIDITIS